ncbi:MAG: hypothetical protein JST04_18350 [Bdellovibrionales bacterium]|nr:hypothetical protein [Bdellovibrionales bacterium]
MSSPTAELRAPFLVVFAREGQEDFVKNEFGLRFLGTKFSFSRPGFLSFKRAHAETGATIEWRAADAANLIFPLRTGFFVGKWTEGKGFAPIEGFDIATSAHRHVHAIDAYTKKDPRTEGETLTLDEGAFARRFPEAAEGLRTADAKRADRAGWNSRAEPGERILNAIAVSEKEVWFALTDLRDSEFGWPGGESRIERAAESPSRASVKIEEAIALLERKTGGPILKAGERAIEIGSAPGGACHALLARGLKVTGVDRAEMAPVVANHPNFTRVDSSIGDWMFPETTAAEWIAIDINAEPKVALREAKPLVDYLKRGVRGIFFTLKLNQIDFALVAERLAKATAADLGMTTYFLKQLPSNHREIAFFGLTSRATAKAFVRK